VGSYPPQDWIPLGEGGAWSHRGIFEKFSTIQLSYQGIKRIKYNYITYCRPNNILTVKTIYSGEICFFLCPDLVEALEQKPGIL
jgi:hypothetical protein